MTYGELKDFVLQLLNRYSVAGSPVAVSYNDQADALQRIPALTRDALYYISTTACKLRATAELTEPESKGDLLVYRLPEDCFRLLSGGLIRVDPQGNCSRYHRYSLMGGNQVLIPKADWGTFTVEYFRYPRVPEGTPGDSEVLDCPPQAQTAVAYYVAAHLAMEDNSFLYASLYNEFEMKMARLQELPATETTVTEDVYGGLR